MTLERKRLTGLVVSIEALNDASARENPIHRRRPSTLHLRGHV